ncbi:MAG: hypothetical protein AVDCRST_MAG57-1347, partial [uncultured Blastococcus sp.]
DRQLQGDDACAGQPDRRRDEGRAGPAWRPQAPVRHDRRLRRRGPRHRECLRQPDAVGSGARALLPERFHRQRRAAGRRPHGAGLRLAGGPRRPALPDRLGAQPGAPADVREQRLPGL